MFNLYLHNFLIIFTPAVVMKRNGILNRMNFDFSFKKSCIMKKMLTIIVLVLFCCQSGYAQKEKNPTDATPLFNPETNCQLRYYYFPNLEAYFDTHKSIYYYKENGEWITAKEIPEGYRGYSIYNKSNVYITDYDDDYPYQFIQIHKKKFPYINSERAKKMAHAKN